MNPPAGRRRVVAQFEHPQPLSSGSQGNIQLLANGDEFIGWGAAPYFSEFNAAAASCCSTPTCPAPTSPTAPTASPGPARPPAPPALAAAAGEHGAAPLTVYASWNGDTRTAGWRVLAGPRRSSSLPVAGAPRSGFETAIATPGAAGLRRRAGARRAAARCSAPPAAVKG